MSPGGKSEAESPRLRTGLEAEPRQPEASWETLLKVVSFYQLYQKRGRSSARGEKRHVLWSVEKFWIDSVENGTGA